jgi:large subunit ribosomal protein L25
MAKQYKLTVEKRNDSGKFSSKNLRNNQKIPGVYYSYDASNILFQIDESEIRSAIQSQANIFTVEVGGKEQNVVFKSVQYHPVTDKIIHIDLYGVDMTKAIAIKIPLVFIGTPMGVQAQGGVLVTSLNEIEISCLPSDIPDNIELDISNLELGANLQAGDIPLDEKFALVTFSDNAVISVTHAAQEEESTVDEELEGEEGVDGEESESSEDGASSDDSKESSNEGENS